ncbi:hypothetical protein COOONC_23700, partial [Cooperia oncophora]
MFRPQIATTPTLDCSLSILRNLSSSVHGGPNDRDSYGLSLENVFLTNRGYAVLQVNYRGSYGFGKRFAKAGNGEWSRKMHLDILDSVKFVVPKGLQINLRLRLWV